jgi:hypothetical protein
MAKPKQSKLFLSIELCKQVYKLLTSCTSSLTLGLGMALAQIALAVPWTFSLWWWLVVVASLLPQLVDSKRGISYQLLGMVATGTREGERERESEWPTPFWVNMINLSNILGPTKIISSTAALLGTLYYAIHENILLDKFADNLLIYQWFIDDVLGVWIPTDPATDDKKWPCTKTN